jgi:predicted metal-binding membrane protein
MRSWRTSTFRPTVSSAPDLTSRVLRHQRLIVAAGVALLAALAWLFVLHGAGMPSGMDMPMDPPPFAALVLMWAVMMVAMMLPSAAPAILLYARVREMRGRDAGIAQSWIFAAGYLAAWLLFSVGAAAIQRFAAGPAMAFGNRSAEAAVLIAAGLYQLSPLKGACLRQCRVPAQFISRHWRPGAYGAVRLGLLHGAYCVGCCWLLMALLFVGGVMNLAWIAALTAIVAIEKLAPAGAWIGRATGAALIAAGAARLLA